MRRCVGWGATGAIAVTAMSIVDAAPAGACGAATQPVTAMVSQPSTILGATAAPSAASLPFTGASVHVLVVVALLLIVVGCAFLLIGGARRWIRPAHAAVAVAVLVASVIGVAGPVGAVAPPVRDAGCPTVLTPSVNPVETGPPPTGTLGLSVSAPPPAVVPESPMAVLLPLGAGGVVAGMVVRRRRPRGGSSARPGR